MLPVMYFHGLNTRGNDLVHIGPWVLGKMHEPICQLLNQKGFKAFPVLPIGNGHFEQVLETTKKSLLAHPEFQKKHRVHFLGHSMGALVARALLHSPEIAEKVESLVTFGAPHHGTKVVERAKELPKPLNKTLAWAGWSIESKMHMIEHLSPDGMSRFNEKYPDLPSVKYASAACFCAVDDLTPPMHALAKLARPGEDSDGLVQAKSQRHGESLGDFSLDHICQIGYFPYFSRSRRAQKSEEFQALVSRFAEFWHSL